ncbi:MAG TPA: four helix bundle protein [Candidatus Atribacteria bacterium]|nr:four helix bundle protein [Candidatus Atribacteria bacterium]
MDSHEDLEVWKLAIKFVTNIYKETMNFPKTEKFGLTNQIRRAAISIPSNIAEGAARNSTKEYIQFLYISLGSIAEIETQLIIAKNLDYLKSENLSKDIKNIKGKLINLIASLKRKMK